jgi:hypothetical protein
VRRRLREKDNIRWNGVEKKEREDLAAKGELYCALGQYPRLWMYPDAILETSSEDTRYELKEKFEGLFLFKARGHNKRNSEGLMIYHLYYSENERLLVRILKYEAEHIRNIKQLRTLEGEMDYVARTAASPSKTSLSKRSYILMRKLAKSNLCVRSHEDKSILVKIPFTKLYAESALKELNVNGTKGKLSPSQLWRAAKGSSALP